MKKGGIKLANLAIGELGVRGLATNINEFLNDVSSDNFKFRLTNIDEINLDEEKKLLGQAKVFYKIEYRWSIDEKELIYISNKYNLNIWIEVFETDLGFREELCVVNGLVVYTDYNEWNYYQGEW